MNTTQTTKLDRTKAFVKKHKTPIIAIAGVVTGIGITLALKKNPSPVSFVSDPFLTDPGTTLFGVIVADNDLSAFQPKFKELLDVYDVQFKL